MEGRIDRGELATSARARDVATFGEFIDLHVADMKEVDKAPGRSKDATLAMLKRELGAVKMTHIDRERVIQFVSRRLGVGAPRSRPPSGGRPQWQSEGMAQVLQGESWRRGEGDRNPQTCHSRFRSRAWQLDYP